MSAIFSALDRPSPAPFHSRLAVAVRALCTAAALLLPAAGLTAQQQAAAMPQQDLPAADLILARYHEAVNASGFAAIESLHSEGELSIPAAGITGTLEIWQGRPNRTLMVAVVPQYGEVRTGYTGETGWSVDPIEGPRLLTGPEALQAADDAHFDSHLRSAALIDSLITIERTSLSGYDCIKVRTVWKTGRVTSDCYSTETGLLVGSLRTHHASSGPAEALILYEEYRDFGDIRMPTRITTRVNGVDQMITLSKVTLNQVPDSAFEPPPGIRALLDR